MDFFFRFDFSNFIFLKYEVFIHQFLQKYMVELGLFLSGIPAKEVNKLFKTFFKEHTDQNYLRVLLITLLRELETKNPAFTRFLSVSNEKYYVQLINSCLDSFDDYKCNLSESEYSEDVFDRTEDEETEKTKESDENSEQLVLIEDNKTFFSDFFVENMLDSSINDPREFFISDGIQAKQS